MMKQYHIKELPDTIGDALYGLYVLEAIEGDDHGYIIYSSEVFIREIRIGKALDGEYDTNPYGPGEVTYLCKGARGRSVTACSPIGDEIVASFSTAGRNNRFFRNKTDLAAEAQLMKENILKRYKRVAFVEIKLQEGVK